MHRSLLITLIAVIALLTTASPSLFAQEFLGERPLPGHDKESKRRTQEAIVQISERWEEDRNPRLIVIVGIQEGEKLVYGQRSQMINRIISPLKRHLRSAINEGIVIPSYKQLQDAKVLERLGRDAGDVLTEAGLDVLKKQFSADLIIDLTMLNSDKRGRYALNMAVVDTRKGTEIASDSLGTVGLNIDEGRGVVLADAIIRSFAKEYAPRRDRPAPSKEFEFKLLGIEEEGGISQKVVREMASLIEECDGNVKWVETDFVGMEDTGFAQMSARFIGRQRDLLNLIENRVLSKLKLAWRIQQADGTVAVVYIFPDDVPAWFRLTNPKSPDFDDTVRLRNAKLAASGLPKLGIVVGEDLHEPLAIFNADAQNPAGGFDIQTLEGLLQDQFTNLGFRVVDSTTLRAQLTKQRGNVERYDNLPHLRQALADLESVDLVLHLNVLPGSNGTKFNARLIDVASSDVIGFQTWPNAAASRLSRHRVNANKPDQVARYLTGQLLSRFDRYSQRLLNTLEIRIDNITDTQLVLGITEALKEQVPQITEVSSVSVSAPVASVEVAYTGPSASLIFSVINCVSSKVPHALIQVAGNTVSINLDPKTLTEEEYSNRHPEPNQSDRPAANPSPQQTPPATADQAVADTGNQEDASPEVARSDRRTGDARPGHIELGGRAGGALSPGDNALESGILFDIIAFEIKEAGPVSVKMSSGDFDPMLIVIDTKDEQHVNDDDAGSFSRSLVVIPDAQPGTYRIVATSAAAGGSGKYELSVEPKTVETGNAKLGDIYGVFVGISDYMPVGSSKGDLKYCRDDAVNLRQALIAHAGMRPENSVLLTDEEATLDRVRDAITAMGSKAGEEDRLIIFYSGHGGRVKRANIGKNDPDSHDLQDETLSLYDGQLYDDEMNKILDASGAGVTVLMFDSCFSGGFSKDVISKAGRVGMFSSEEDVTSVTAGAFRAGGYLSLFAREAAGDNRQQADLNQDGYLSVAEFGQYIYEGYREKVVQSKSAKSNLSPSENLGYQHLILDRGGVNPNLPLMKYQ